MLTYTNGACCNALCLCSLDVECCDIEINCNLQFAESVIALVGILDECTTTPVKVRKEPYTISTVEQWRSFLSALRIPPAHKTVYPFNLDSEDVPLTQFLDDDVNIPPSH